MNKKLLTDLIGGLLIALIVVVGYKLSPMLLPKADVTVMPDPGCSLHRGACKASLQDGGSIELSSSVQPIPMVKPFKVQVLLQGIAAQRVAVDFAGIGMSMGLNRPELVSQGNGRYVAEVSLPVCITGEMDWQATVLVDTATASIAVPYRFSGGGH